jgi:catechol 2,3-dioxygenase-like lactoylglutathione lyase family enzyme
VEIPLVKRIHISINVTDLAKALGFYRSFLAAEPIKVTPDFAKFELDVPNLNLALNVVPFENTKGVLNHLGFQVNDADEVQAFGERLEKAGLTPIWGKSVAEQHKVWAYDPDGNEWEVFFE